MGSLTTTGFRGQPSSSSTTTYRMTPITFIRSGGISTAILARTCLRTITGLLIISRTDKVTNPLAQPASSQNVAPARRLWRSSSACSPCEDDPGDVPFAHREKVGTRSNQDHSVYTNVSCQRHAQRRRPEAAARCLRGPSAQRQDCLRRHADLLGGTAPYGQERLA